MYFVEIYLSGSSDSRTASGKGETLLITNISRHCDATYECVANNGVPISDKRQLRVEVECEFQLYMYCC